jgi:amidophosphoribosyltransferase
MSTKHPARFTKCIGILAGPGKRRKTVQSLTGHRHIYGIDLASSSELIAHHRDSAAIAKHIGADDVVYQNLGDLESACARLSPRDPATQKFEVGVFCGKYVTPVDKGYFEHLERIRGENRKQKVMEKAREAVVHGTANPQQIRMAAKGVVSSADNVA